jgi:hypothetical protein
MLAHANHNQLRMMQEGIFNRSPSHPYLLSDMDYEEGELPFFDEETDRMGSQME